VKVFSVKPFIVKDATKLMPPWTGLYCLSFLCLFNAAGYFYLFRLYGKPGNPDFLFSAVYSALSMLAMFLGVLFFGVALLSGRASRTHSELTTRLAEQESRIRQLEEQIAALTPPTPTR
jgi:hypothetical protein